jgi:hypothetical protein
MPFLRRSSLIERPDDLSGGIGYVQHRRPLCAQAHRNFAEGLPVTANVASTLEFTVVGMHFGHPSRSSTEKPAFASRRVTLRRYWCGIVAALNYPIAS